jgi:uncharacterized protein YodC (DUF2158 family)
MNSAPEFMRGDRVRLKAKALPVMVVHEVYGPMFTYRYRCTWADPDGTERAELYRREDLEPENETGS